MLFTSSKHRYFYLFVCIRMVVNQKETYRTQTFGLAQSCKKDKTPVFLGFARDDGTIHIHKFFRQPQSQEKD